jgi:hypothetical protein
MRRAALAMITGEIAQSVAVTSEHAAPVAVDDIVRVPGRKNAVLYSAADASQWLRNDRKPYG